MECETSLNFKDEIYIKGGECKTKQNLVLNQFVLRKMVGGEPTYPRERIIKDITSSKITQ
jgi:hypothetical protein